MRRWAPMFVLALASGVASASGAQTTGPAEREDTCMPSPTSRYARDTHLSPRAGGACLLIATVYEGATCETARRAWSVELGCSEAHRLRVTDAGRLVSILAPRASNPLWPIVRLFAPDGSGVRRTSLRLSDLPGAATLHVPVRMSFEEASLVMETEEGRAALSLADVEALSPE